MLYSVHFRNKYININSIIAKLLKTVPRTSDGAIDSKISVSSEKTGLTTPSKCEFSGLKLVDYLQFNKKALFSEYFFFFCWFFNILDKKFYTITFTKTVDVKANML